jgi:hypothetical protein
MKLLKDVGEGDTMGSRCKEAQLFRKQLNGWKTNTGILSVGRIYVVYTAD